MPRSGAINIYFEQCRQRARHLSLSQGSYGHGLSGFIRQWRRRAADGDQFIIDTYPTSPWSPPASGPNELSGGIVAISQGGDGGAGTKSTTGGRGGKRLCVQLDPERPIGRLRFRQKAIMLPASSACPGR